jgi:ribonuclease D
MEGDEAEHSDVLSVHDVPAQLSFHMPMFADDATVRPEYWSHSLYHGPSGQDVEVTYCQTLEESEAVAQRLLRYPVLGFDIEWKEGGGIYIGENVSLIQLASENEIGLFHIALHPGSVCEDLVAPSLKSIIESPFVIKAGFRIARDGELIAQHLGVSPDGFLELDALAKTVEGPKKLRGMMSLSKLVELHLGGIPLYKDKSVRRSDWSQVINSKQKKYAAADAYAGLMLFHCLNHKRLDLSTTHPLPEFVTIKTAGKSMFSSSQNDVTDSQENSQASSLIMTNPSNKRKRPGLNSSENELYWVLHGRRLELASHHRVFARNIVTNKSLEAMAKSAPTTLQALRKIRGIGSKTTKRYGSDFVNSVLKHVGSLQCEQTESEISNSVYSHSSQSSSSSMSQDHIETIGQPSRGSAK